MKVPSCKHLLWAATLAVSFPHLARGEYSAANTFDLNPSGYVGSGLSGGFGTHASGSALRQSNDGYDALLWTRISTSPARLNPPSLSNCNLAGADRFQQVGSGAASITSGPSHALVWNGSAASCVDLHPASFTSSSAYAVQNGHQVGYGRFADFSSHALLWSNTADSCVDLNPTGYTSSLAQGVFGNEQVGSGNVGNGPSHALLWNGTAESVVDLHPVGFDSSYARATSGTQQVGIGAESTSGTFHALLWNGSAASVVDLNPAGMIYSALTSTNGSRQAGAIALPSFADQHAAVWRGTAQSYQDLHAFVPGSATESDATAIDAYGNVFGSAVLSGAGHAMVWYAGNMYIGTGDAWNNSASWTAGVLTAGADVEVVLPDTTDRTITYAGNVALGQLQIDNSNTGHVNLALNADLTTSSALVGVVGRATVTHTAGTHNVTGTDGLQIATQAGSAGTYTHSGGVLNVTNDLSLGGTQTAAGGAGVLNISGGSVTVGGTLKVWNSGDVAPDGTRLHLSGGTLNVGHIDTTDGLGAAAQRLDWTDGNLNLTNSGWSIDQTGGYQADPAYSNLGGSQTLSETRQLTCTGNALVGAALNVGEVNTQLTQTGGRTTIGGYLQIAGPSYAQYMISGGTMTCANAYVGGTPTESTSLGRFIISDEAHVFVPGTLKVWDTPYPSGVEFAGGNVTVGSLDIDSNSNFLWYRGTLHVTGAAGLTVNESVLAGNGINPDMHLIVDHSLNINNNAYFLMTGGTVTAPTTNIDNGFVVGGGIFSGEVRVNAGGHIVLGEGAGQLNVDNLTLNPGAAVDRSLGVGLSGGDFLNAVSALTLNGASTFNVLDNGVENGTYTVIDYAGAIAGSGTLTLGDAPAGHRYQLINDPVNTLFRLIVAPLSGGTHGLWNGGVGNWSDATKWSDGVVPNDTTVHVKIDAGNAINSTVTLDQDESAGQLSISAGDELSISASHTLSVTAGIDLPTGATLSLAAGGNINFATFDQSGGNVNAAGDYNVPANAAHSISSGALNVAQSLVVGYGARSNAAISQSGGTITVGDNFIVGLDTTGSVTQSAGVVNANGANSLRIGLAAGSAGTYSLSGTGVLNANGVSFNGGLLVGESGSGTLIVSGGNLNIKQTAVVGNNAGARGVVVQSGGIVVAGSSSLAGGIVIGRNAGSSGTYTISNTGSLTVHGGLQVGFSGNGAFQQDGGEVHIASHPSINGLVFIGNGPGSTGVVTVNAGTFTSDAGSFVAGDASGPGGAGTFNINGGYVRSGLRVWDNGVVNVAPGATLDVGSNASDNIANNGSISNRGTIIIGGSIVNLTGGSVRRAPSGGGVITQFAGQAKLASGTAVDGGTFRVKGGIATAAGSFVIGKRDNSNANLDVNGGYLGVDGLLGIGNSGTITVGRGTGHVTVSDGTLAADTVVMGSAAGGSGEMTISGSGHVIVGGGFAFDALNLNGGTLSVLDQAPPAGEDPVLDRSIVGGYLRDGAMHVTGGVVTSPRIKLGVTSGNMGTYTQAGGMVSVGTVSLGSAAGGRGDLTLAAGTLAVSAQIDIASAGTLHLSGGTLASVPRINLSGAGKVLLAPSSSPGGNQLLRASTLNIDAAGSGFVDLNDDDAILSATPAGTVRNYLKRGYDFGNFDGSGAIQSSAARNNPSGNTALGMLTASEYANNNGDPKFDGVVVQSNDVLIKYTYFGDVDFNGAIDSTDYNLIDFGFLTGASGWANGDVDYSGAIDGTDYNLIDFAFVTQNGFLRRAISYLDGTDRSTHGMTSDPSLVEVVKHFDAFGNAYAQGFLANVPEPTAAMAAMVLTMSLQRRRKSRCAAR